MSRASHSESGLPAEKVDSLPRSPGVYLFKAAQGKVLYVGKAKDLRARVRQYVSGSDGRSRIPALMRRAIDVDIFVTSNAKEALLLENELIKQHKPMFNVKLRDDKQYLGLRLDTTEEWPRLSTVRRFKKDGADYFGPYTSSTALKEVLSDLRRIFPLRSCTKGTFKDYARRGRPCIEYEMKRCLGPCCGLADIDVYAEQVKGTKLFLKGRSGEVVENLNEAMRDASAGERFEEAARIRDRIEAVEKTLEQQQIVSGRGLDHDVFGLSRQGGEFVIAVLHVREGRVVGTEDFGFSRIQLDEPEVMSSFIGQYYGKRDGRQPPREILSSVGFDDGGSIAEWLMERSGRRVVIRRPVRGAGRRLVESAVRNSALALLQRLDAAESVELALEGIREECRLEKLPRHIECYDVSNLQGTLAVASRVVFVEGVPDKKQYRKYRIKEAKGGDDYDCLREVMLRRLGRVEDEPLPDLLMVDGGRGQLGVVIAALADAGLSVDTLGLSKERDLGSPSARVKRSGGLKAERIFRPGRANPIMMPSSSRGLLLLQRVRDESHRFAIEYQRQLRRQVGMASILEELPGIGPSKRQALLRDLGSLRKVREADLDRLTQVPGVSLSDAQAIYRFFRSLEAGAAPSSQEADSG
ncbi:MAG: excinuclease ABC subunit C [Deltaproteobacteria bacterium]|nr:excinuclease ABC subunit C [Deltaproteobacteria bacterium]